MVKGLPEAWLADNKVTGGAVIMDKDGPVHCLCLNLDEDFKGFLFDHCKFDTPSGGRHGVGQFSKTASGTVQLKLPWQIRFCTKEVYFIEFRNFACCTKLVI
jgi:hypothetical protein